MRNFVNGVTIMFKPVKSLHPTVNRSRIFNTYDTILEILICVVEYAFFSNTNQMTLIHFFLIGKVLTVFGNYIVHVGLLMRFVYCMVLNTAAGLFAILTEFLLLIRMLNLSKICQLLDTHYLNVTSTEKRESSTICTSQKIYYIAWMVIEIISIGMKVVTIYFGWRAHLIVEKNRSKNAKK